jgi:NTP pyrophosphatase (non-canonical NTP hydrolase)
VPVKTITVDQYQAEAEVTEAKNFDEIRARMTDDTLRLVHAGFGMASEVGEWIGQLKKHLFYGTPLDKVNLSEEAGDILWYLALNSNVPGMRSMAENMATNNAKLRARYGDKFSIFAAINRDLGKERAILETEPIHVYGAGERLRPND